MAVLKNIMTFDQLQLIESISKALKEEGYTYPTPIQEQAIPLALKNQDILGCAQTGTGKTAAFTIPILQQLSAEPWVARTQRPIRALILTPTRELAVQIGESIAAYGKYTGIKHTVIFGGVPQKAQTDILKSGVDILVATPGRLLDLIQQRFVYLGLIKHFILDEADRMLDMGFIHDVKKVIALLPERRQTLFFSATMPPEIQQLANSILVDPVKVEVTPVSSTVEKIEQVLYYVNKANKRALILHLLKKEDIKSVLVFTRTKHGADNLSKFLNKANIYTEAIHGDKSQNARQRALKNFKNHESRVLIATDIAARGIDIDDLAHVINFDLPNVAETYVHRIGRTGRAGASGKAISFCDIEEKDELRDIQKLIGLKIPVEENHPYVLNPEDMHFMLSSVKASTLLKKSGEDPKNKKKRWFGNKKS